jgi:hypothetical protein
MPLRNSITWRNAGLKAVCLRGLPQALYGTCSLYSTRRAFGESGAEFVPRFPSRHAVGGVIVVRVCAKVAESNIHGGGAKIQWPNPPQFEGHAKRFTRLGADRA